MKVKRGTKKNTVKIKMNYRDAASLKAILQNPLPRENAQIMELRKELFNALKAGGVN